jgi:hypothetical protein
MKTAVEWLVDELPKGDFEHQQKVIEQAKEIEKQQQDEFAIGFAEWLLDLKLWQNEIFIKNSTEKLLEIYKKEKDYDTKR